MTAKAPVIESQEKVRSKDIPQYTDITATGILKEQIPTPLQILPKEQLASC